MGEKLLRDLSWCKVQAASLFPRRIAPVLQIQTAVQRATPTHHESTRVLELDATVLEKQKRTGTLSS